MLYNEEHPNGIFFNKGDYIANQMTEDLKKIPDLLFVMGTSLKVSGIENFVKKCSKVVKNNLGKTILINNRILEKKWESFFDYVFLGDCDEICKILKNFKYKSVQSKNTPDIQRKINESLKKEIFIKKVY